MRVEQLVNTWLSVITLHVDYQHCYEAAKMGLASGNELVSFPCPKFGAVYCDQLSKLGSFRLNIDVFFAGISGLSIHLCKGILWLH